MDTLVILCSRSSAYNTGTDGINEAWIHNFPNLDLFHGCLCFTSRRSVMALSLRAVLPFGTTGH